MERYTLLFRDNNGFTALSPEELQAAIAKYKAWGKRVREAGHMVGGNKLVDGSGRVMRSGPDGKPRITDGPYTETKDIMGGYYIIEAESYEEAVEISSDCPHLQFGSIEVRQIQVT